jgi:hypothetical protein
MLGCASSEAGYIGFRRLADFISGAHVARKKIDTTAPVS